MNKFFKPASLLFYFLSVLLFFLLGSMIASFSGVADNQGLAAAAIVIGYGLITALIALIASIIITGYLTLRQIKNINKIFGVLIALLIGILVIKGILRKNKAETSPDKELPPKVTSLLAQVTTPAQKNNELSTSTMGLGMVKPDFYQHPVMFFYSDPNLQKSINEHLPYDSLVFRQTEIGYEINYAPPWFVPAVLKMDYDVLYLNAQTLHGDFIEVRVNEQTGRTAWISKYDCNLYHWPDFLLLMNSIEPLDPVNNPLRIKPLRHASPVNSEYTYLRPLGIKAQWILVEMLDKDLKPVNKGWLRWHEDGQLQIKWSLFS